MKVLFDCPEFLIFHKPHKFHSVSLDDSKESAAAVIGEKFPQLGEIQCRNKNDFGLLNRLDFETEGLLLFAKTQLAYDFLRNEQENFRIEKKYLAKCDKTSCMLKGFPPFQGELTSLPREIQSFFRGFGEGQREVRPCLEENRRKNGTKKQYSTKVEKISKKNGCFEIDCTILSGFRHQIRCHLAWAGFPIIGDKIYNPKSAAEILELYAVGLTFPHPKNGEIFSFENFPSQQI